MRIIRGIVQSVVAMAGELMRITMGGVDGETIEEVEHVGTYGFSSRPRPGAEAVARRSGAGYLVVQTADRRYNIPLDDGDVAMHTSTGDFIKCKGAGGMEIMCSGTVIIDAQAIKIGGSDGLKALLTEAAAAVFNQHVHTSPNGLTTTPQNASALPLQMGAAHQTTNTTAK
jgi:phage gp45-like